MTKGPYNVLHGPGLAFFDVKLLRAPRYEDGYQSFGSSVLEYQTNGEQWNGRQSFEGGSWDWGYRVGYSHRTGSDYEAGDGSKFIDSYNSRLPDFALGADLTENSSIDFHYLRLDQTNVEFPGQVFDIDFLVTDAYEIRYAVEPQRFFDQLRLEVWYNRTRFEGNANSPGKRQQIPVLNDFLASGFTDADAMSAGGSTAISWGDVQEYLTIGADYRYLKQRLNEIDTLLPSLLTFNYPIPRSHTSHPGAFIERQLTPNESLTVRTGARVDWVSANADESVPGTERFDLERS